MPIADMEVSECCKYCPYLKPVKGTCGHAQQQALVSKFSTERRSTCPVFQREVSREMATLVERITE